MDIPLFKVFMSPDALLPVRDVLTSGQLTQGPRVEEYENRLGAYLGNPRVLSLNSATAGLTLALKMCDLQEGDVVLTPALTCWATTSAILANQYTPKWIDVDPLTSNVCLKDIKRKLSPQTKVIVVVHWGGNPVDLDGLRELQDYSEQEFGFRPQIVEDCAHAFGAEFGGRKIGNHGNICVFSTQAIKLLTTGDGGVITLPTQELYDRCKLLRWYGIDRDKRNYKGKDFRLENDISESGFKFHMNDINATLGLANLPNIPELLEKNRKNAEFLTANLSGREDIKPIVPQAGSSNWLYTVRVTGGKKQKFMDDMKKRGVMTSQVHNRNDINSCVARFKEPLPQLDQFEKEMVCIPVGWWLSADQLRAIVGRPRVAIQYCGLVRGFKFEKTRDKIYENLIKPIREQGFEVDIFWHTYDHEYDPIFETVDKDKFPIVSSRVDPDQPLHDSLPGVVEYFSWEHQWTREHKFGWFKFWNSIKQVNSMRIDYEKENNINYDFVINTSSQMEPQNIIDNLNVLEQDRMYCPGYAHFGGYYDSFFLGQPEHMNHVAGIYDEFVTNQNVPRGFTIQAERIFATWVRSRFIMSDTMNVRFHRIRFDGEVIDH